MSKQNDPDVKKEFIPPSLSKERIVKDYLNIRVIRNNGAIVHFSNIDEARDYRRQYKGAVLLYDIEVE